MSIATIFVYSYTQLVNKIIKKYSQSIWWIWHKYVWVYDPLLSLQADEAVWFYPQICSEYQHFGLFFMLARVVFPPYTMNRCLKWVFDEKHFRRRITRNRDHGHYITPIRSEVFLSKPFYQRLLYFKIIIQYFIIIIYSFLFWYIWDRDDTLKNWWIPKILDFYVYIFKNYEIFNSVYSFWNLIKILTIFFLLKFGKYNKMF